MRRIGLDRACRGLLALAALGSASASCSSDNDCQSTATCASETPTVDAGSDRSTVAEAESSTVADAGASVAQEASLDGAPDSSIDASPDADWDGDARTDSSAEDAGAEAAQADSVTDASEAEPADGSVDADAGPVDAAIEAADTTPPTVVSSIPSKAQVDVGRVGPYSVTFSEPMAAASLTGGGLKLRLGTTDVAGTVKMTADNVATFTPAHDLVLAGAYTLVVTTQAKDLAGNAIATEWQAPFAVRDGVWSATGHVAPTDTADPSTVSVSVPLIGMDADGNAIAAWTVQNAPRFARYVHGTGWKPLVVPEGPSWVDSQVLAVSANGMAAYAGMATVNSAPVPVASVFDGTVWTPLRKPEGISTFAYGAASSVGIDAKGTAVVLWTSTPSGQSTGALRPTTFDAASGWGSLDSYLATDGVPYNAQTSMLLAADGTGYALWPNPQGGFLYSRYDRTKTPPASGPQSVSGSSAISAFSASMGADGAGSFLYSEADKLKAVTFDSTSGAWGSPSTLLNANPQGDTNGMGSESTSPIISVANGPNHSAIAAWLELGLSDASTRNTYDLHVKRFDPATGWASESPLVGSTDAEVSKHSLPSAEISLDNAGNGFAMATAPKLTIDSSGTLTGEVTYYAYLCRHRGGVFATGAEAITTTEIRYAYNLPVDTATSSNGNAIVVWWNDSLGLLYRVFE